MTGAVPAPPPPPPSPHPADGPCCYNSDGQHSTQCTADLCSESGCTGAGGTWMPDGSDGCSCDCEADASPGTAKAAANGAQRLNTEIKNLEKEVAENQAALDKATAIRQKQLAEFNEEEKDLLESISALKSAVTVLSKHNSFLQIPRSHIAGVAATVQNEMQKHSGLLSGVLTHKERRAVASFVQSPEDYFDAEPTFKQSYAPQSGEIFGILKQMKETFETNLSSSQKEEMA